MKKEIKDGLKELRIKTERDDVVFIENVPFKIRSISHNVTGMSLYSVKIEAEFINVE